MAAAIVSRVARDAPDGGPLTVHAAQPAAVEAVTALGVDTADISLVRAGTRVVFRLAGRRILVRVSKRDRLAAAKHEVEVARWLQRYRVPVDQPWPGSGVQEINGLVVTLWVARDGRWGTTRALASVLRLLHDVAPASGPALNPWDPFPEMRLRVGRAEALNEDVRSRLLELVDGAEREVGRLRFKLPPGVIHGDASVGNLLHADEGELVLFDLDGVSLGPREWDLVVTGVYRDLGWHNDAEYNEFALAYGFDIAHWEGYPALANAQRLRMISWLAGKASAEDIVAMEELRRRVAGLLDPSAAQPWQPL